MTDKRTQIRVGLFAFGAAALVAVVLVVFGGLKFWKHHDHFFVEFDDSVMGLAPGAQVYLNGIEVGTVEDIAISPSSLSRVRVEISIDKRTPVHADTHAFLSMAGITGLRVIDLKGGSLTAPAIPPGGQILAGIGTIDKLENRAEKLADQSGQLMEGAVRIVASANQVLANVQAVTDPVALKSIVASTRTASADLADAASALKTTVAENRVALRHSLDSASKIIDTQVPALVGNANALVSDLRGVIHGNESVLQSAVADIRQASRSFKELAREVRERPSRMLFSTDQPDRKLP